MALREAISFCRICTGGCGTRLTIDDADDRIVAIRADPESPLSAGYACFKGLQAEEAHHGPARLLHPLKRTAEGTQVPIASEKALDEIAERLGEIIAHHGPESVAVYCGNGSMFSSAAYAMHRSFLNAIGSDQYFSTLTIDQSAKLVSFGRMGGWTAGYPDFERMDVAMLVGANPLVSHASLGFLSVDPVKRLKRARARGLKLIVIDPRRTETAANADIFLQPYPGQDAAIAGAIVRMILSEGWGDRAFLDAHVGAGGLARLAAAVAPLEADMVERRAGLQAGDIRRAAEAIGKARICGVYGATGPAMQPFSNLAQHMVDCINLVCGGFLRAGDAVHRANVMEPVAPVTAAVVPPLRPWEQTGPSRIRGTRTLYGERPTATLADEILTPGKGRIRALILGGGNPLTSFPDQRRAAAAMGALELLVAIDPWRTPSTDLAHYVLPPTMQYERADLPLNLPGYACWPGTWAQYTLPVIAPPAGSDVVHDWYVYWAIANRLGLSILHDGKAPLDMTQAPTCDDVLAAQLTGAPITLDELKRHPHGLHVELGAQMVQPGADSAQFDPMPDDVAKELDRFLARTDRPGRIERDGRVFTHLLSTRRMRDLFNSNGRAVRSVRRRTPYNPAYMHPDDLAALDLAEGDLIALESAFGKVVAVAGRDPAVRRGVVSMAHGWGDAPGSQADPRETGGAVNALIDADRHFEAVNAMPHMSAVPITITPMRQTVAALQEPDEQVASCGTASSVTA
ncbi:molybdopterin-containing oxidoreductase family protein [Sphingomonas profundi]|uniref:molybdopterin-containing oxidoreductase family protein n=1 Tax=Alterirhizorhabdus profundi TaxID=2681549 RepID=UPI0012E77776|nr:molybdopterin-dependent oxidoreductase [Sphingomonas profundi]